MLMVAKVAAVQFLSADKLTCLRLAIYSSKKSKVAGVFCLPRNPMCFHNNGMSFRLSETEPFKFTL